MLEQIMQVYEACEAEKMQAFERGIEANDLSRWNKEADKIELAAYQKIKAIIRVGEVIKCTQ